MSFADHPPVTVTLLRSTLAQLHLACEAMGIQVADVDLETMDQATRDRIEGQVSDHVRAWINDQPPPAVHHEAYHTNRSHARLTGRPLP